VADISLLRYRINYVRKSIAIQVAGVFEPGKYLSD